MLLATGIKVLETLIGTATKLGTAALVKKAGKTIWNRFKKEPESTENKELLRITRIAYLRASLAACRHLLKTGESIKGNARQTLKDLIDYLSGQIKEARAGDWFRKSQMTEALEVLINSSEEDQDKLLKETLQDLLLSEIHQANILPINAYKDLLINGWQDAGKQMDWLELMASSLQEELGQNEVAQSTLQLKFRNELNQKLNGFDKHWQAFENYLSRLSEYHRAFWEKLEEIHKDQQAGFKETYDGQAKLGQQIGDAKEEILDQLGSRKKSGQNKELTLPLAVPKVFLGREKDLDQLHKALLGKSGKQVQILVNGRGGIGKTSLAAQYYHQYLSAYDHLAWLSATNGIADALISLHKAFGLEFQTETQKERREVVLLKLAQLPGLKLLVLDNANDLKDLREHYDQVRAIKDLHLLITSRIDNFRKTDTLKIEGISEKATIALFREYYPDLTREEEPLVLSIRKAVNENTLVIELLSKNLSKVNRFGKVYTLEELLKDLLEKGVLQISSSKPVELSYQEFKKASPKEVISAMYEIYHLPNNEQQLLQCISLLPTESIPFPYMKVMLEEIEDFEDGLRELVDKGWVEHDRESNTFKWSPVVQAVIRSKTDNLFEAVQVLISNLIILLNDSHVHHDNYIHASHFVRYAENVCSHLKEESSTLLGGLWQNIGGYYQHTGDLIKCLEACKNMKQQFQTVLLKGADLQAQNGLAISYSKLGETHSALGNLEEALRFFDDETELFEQLFKDYPNNVSFKNGLAISYEKLGKTHAALGNLQEALRFFEQRSELGKQLFKDYPNNVSFKNGLAISYEKIGETHSALGNLEEALRFFEQGSELGKQLFQDYPNNVSFKNGLAIAYSKLGETHSALGNLEEALRFFEQRSELAKQLFKDYPNNVSFKNGLAISYVKLGQTELQKEDLVAACARFQQAKMLWEELVVQSPQHAQFRQFLESISQMITKLDCNE